MKAIVYTKYGPPEVLQLKEVEIPPEHLYHWGARFDTASKLVMRTKVTEKFEFYFGLREVGKTLKKICSQK